MYTERYDSPMGTLWLAGDERGLRALSFYPVEAADPEPAAGRLEPVKAWLDAYYEGRPYSPDFPMAPDGTAFQKLIWQMLLQIPFGETRSYGDLAAEAARQMGREKMSAQAVGQAVGRNPIAIIIPCHRIVGANGSLTGYASGLERKQWLLRHEGWL